MPRLTPTPPRFLIYGQLFDVLMDKRAGWGEKAIAMGYMRRIAPRSRTYQSRGHALHPTLGDLIREAIDERIMT